MISDTLLNEKKASYRQIAIMLHLYYVFSKDTYVYVSAQGPSLEGHMTFGEGLQGLQLYLSGFHFL